MSDIAPTIRLATPDDLPAITDIYNEAVLATTSTFDTQPRTLAQQRAWLESHGAAHPVLVAEVSGSVVGWASLTRWSDRPAYDITVEFSFFVFKAHQGRGVGGSLLRAIVDEAGRLGYHALIGRIAEGSDASLHLAQRFGFVKVGTMRQVGRKFGRLLDVHIMQRLLGDGPG